VTDVLSPQSIWTNQTRLELYRKKMANNRNAMSQSLLAEATLVLEELFVISYEQTEGIASGRLHRGRNHVRATQTIEQKRQGRHFAMGRSSLPAASRLKRTHSLLIKTLERELPDLKPLVQLKNHSQLISARRSSVALIQKQVGEVIQMCTERTASPTIQ